MVINFQDQRISKGELAEKLYGESGLTFDCAIPQSWVQRVQDRFTDKQLQEFGNIAAHFVYVYDDNDRSQYIAPLTKTGCKILGCLALSI